MTQDAVGVDKYFGTTLKATQIRLGAVLGSPVSRFWAKEGQNKLRQNLRLPFQIRKVCRKPGELRRNLRLK